MEVQGMRGLDHPENPSFHKFIGSPDYFHEKNCADSENHIHFLLLLLKIKYIEVLYMAPFPVFGVLTIFIGIQLCCIWALRIQFPNVKTTEINQKEGQ